MVLFRLTEVLASAPRSPSPREEQRESADRPAAIRPRLGRWRRLRTWGAVRMLVRCSRKTPGLINMFFICFCFKHFFCFIYIVFNELFWSTFWSYLGFNGILTDALNQIFMNFSKFAQGYVPKVGQNTKKARVLAPGSGLSRLPFECAKRGYAAQGNEFSYHMLQGCKWVSWHWRMANIL